MCLLRLRLHCHNSSLLGIIALLLLSKMQRPATVVYRVGTVKREKNDKKEQLTGEHKVRKCIISEYAQ